MNTEQRKPSDRVRRAPLQLCSARPRQPSSSRAPVDASERCCCGDCSEQVSLDTTAPFDASIDADSTLALAGLQRKVRNLASPRGIALLGFGLFAALLLWRDDSARAFSALPYVVFLAFPLLHLFLLRGEGRADALRPEREQRSH